MIERYILTLNPPDPKQKKENLELRKNIFHVLLDLYGIVIALALTTSIALVMIAPNGAVYTPLQLEVSSLLLFGAFFITIVPFYHGASVYLLKNYKDENKSLNRAAPLVDFIVLTIEGILFFAVGSSVKFLDSFEQWLSLVFVLDIVWIGFSYFASRDKNHAPYKWAIINLCMLVFLIVIFGINSISLPQIYYLVFIAALVRSVADYGLNYSYYFPSSKNND